MIWSNSPHPFRCDCKVITEAQEKAGVVCGMHAPGPHIYVEEPRSMWG